jgi:cytochrome c oxidase subunit 3
MALFLLSLSILFLASIIGYLIVRARADVWPPPGMPHLPRGLWVSTIVLLISSGTMHAALTAIRRGNAGALIGTMLITTLLGVVFLVSQVINWAWLIAIHATAGKDLYLFLFYLLTGLHGAHVIGGLIALTVVTVKAFRGRYTAADHGGVKLTAIYWHFLDVVWLVMFVVMFLL